MWKYLVLLAFVGLQQCFAFQEASEGEFQADLFEGDIKMPLAEVLGRAGTATGTWPRGIFYYELSNGIRSSRQAMNAFNAAKKEWEYSTCIKLVEGRGNGNYVEFVTGKGGCYSTGIGMRGRGRQEINLDQGCWNKGTVVHEIGHALGFWHEQSRIDRDKFITIKWQNIKPGRESQFRIAHQSKTHDTPYDYASIMHYPKWAFQKARGLDTIVPRKQGVQIGQRSSLSEWDVKQMNIMYKCPGSCRDNDSNCSGWTSYCDSHDYVKENCRKTCRLCGGVSSCVDKYSNCREYT